MSSKRELARQERIGKYYECLISLRQILKYAGDVNRTEFVVDNKLNKAFFSQLIKGGILLEENGSKGPLKWNTIEPTSKMAIELDNRLNEQAAFYYKKSNPRNEVTTVEETELVYKSNPVAYQAKIFFGLIKINIEPIKK